MIKFTDYIFKKNNGIEILSLLISSLRVRVSIFTIKNELLNHPDYPSLLSLSDCLTSWNVPNQAFKVNQQSCILEELSFPFIAHQKIAGGQFILVHGVENGYVIGSDENKKNQSISEDIFRQSWDGILLYAENDSSSGEADYYHGIIKGCFNLLRLPFLISTILLGVFYAIDYHALTWFYCSILILSLLGTITSVLLLIQNIDANNSFIQKLCSLGKKNNCNTILQSDVSKVTSWLNWSEVGMFYFSGYFICLLLFPSSIGILSWLSLSCLPYTFYSIGYQFKTNNWCILCCTVQILLWLSATVLFSSSSFLEINHNDIISNLGCYLLSFLFPIAIWSYIKPFFLKANNIEPLNRQLKKFKFNSSMFNLLISSQAQYSVPNELMPIVIGNRNAQTVITMVSNPFCNPCAKAHTLLEKLLKEREDIQLKIVFSTANDENRTQVAKHLTALSQLEDEEIVKAALNEWYSQTDRKYDRWSEKYPIAFNDEADTVTIKQREWCNLSDIHATPTILINGYKLISPYRLEDIVHLLN